VNQKPFSTRALSRIHGVRRINAELRRLLIKAVRAGEHRELRDDDRIWLRRVIDRLQPLIEEGDQVLSGLPDPRDRRRVRKRQRPLPFQV